VRIGNSRTPLRTPSATHPWRPGRLLGLEGRRVGIPHPGYFAERVWICLIAKELTFLPATKSLQEYEKNGFAIEAQRTQSWERSDDPTPRGATQIVIKMKGLREKGFVSV
jgi:hypothetical protein